MSDSLSDLQQGQSGVVLELQGGTDFQRKLRAMGIREGKKLDVKARHPFGGPVVIEVDGRQSTIGRGMAAKITIEQSEES